MEIYNKDISETLLESMQILIDASISKVNYDKTLLYTVIDDSKKSEGIYLVTDGEIEFEAISNEEKYKVDDQVYVTITQGDFSNDKIIVGKKNQTEEEIINFTPEIDKIVQVEKYKTSEYNNGQEITIKPGEEKRIAWIPWKDRDIDNDFNRILLSLSYSCDFNNYNVVNGTFGMHFHFVSCMDNLIRNYGNNEINFILPITEEKKALQDRLEKIGEAYESLGCDYDQSLNILQSNGKLKFDSEILNAIRKALSEFDPNKWYYFTDHLNILIEVLNEYEQNTEGLWEEYYTVLDNAYQNIYNELENEENSLYEQIEKIENNYLNDPNKCENTNEFLEYLYNFNHIESNKDKQLIISDPYVTFDNKQMIGNIYNTSGLPITQNSFRIKDDNKKNIVGCFITFYVEQDFKYQNYNGQIVEATEQQKQNFIFKLIDSAVTFGYDQEDFNEDALILNSYDAIDFIPSDIQRNENAKSINAKWIHYDEQEQKYICLIQKIETIDEISRYRFVNSVDTEQFYFKDNEDELYNINWYEESIGEPGDEWSGYYWKLLRSTAMYKTKQEAEEYINSLIKPDIDELEIHKQAYGNIMTSPYENSKNKISNNNSTSNNPQDIINGIVGTITNIFARLTNPTRFLYSYLDIIYMPVTSDKTTSVKAVITQKYPLTNEDGSEKTDSKGNIIYSKKRIANSNILNFLNERYIEKQKYNELVLNIIDDQKEFFLYEENCQIENPKLSEKIRTLQIELPTGNEINNLKVTWKIPLTNSMIESPIKKAHLNKYQDGRGGYYNISGTIQKQDVLPYSFNYYPSFDKLTDTDQLSNIFYSGNTLFIVYEYDKEQHDEIYLSQIIKQSFRIKDYYNIGATNNNIGCEVSINNGAILGWATKTLLFGQKSSNGSEYNFSIYFTEDSNKFFDVQANETIPVTIQPQLYSTSLDLNESAIQNILNTVEYKVLPKEEKINFEDISIITQKRATKDLTRMVYYSNPENKPYGEYIEASVEVNGITLTAYLAIPVRLNSGYTGIQAPIHFNYSSQGEKISYLKEPLHLYGENNSTSIEGVNYYWSELLDEGSFVLTNDNIKSNYKNTNLTITKANDPRGWYKINVGYSLPTTGNFSSLSLSKGLQYTIGNTLSLYKGSTYQSSKLYNTSTITIQEISGNTIYVTGSNLQTSSATQNWYIVPLGNTKLGPNIRHCNSFDSETKQPWQNYDSSDWYTFSYIPIDKYLHYAKSNNTTNLSHLDLNNCENYDTVYQVANNTTLAGNYYLYESCSLPINNSFINMEADAYRLKEQYFTVALVKRNGQPHIKFKDINAINFGNINGASFNNLIANIKNNILNKEKTRIDKLSNLTDDIKEDYKKQVDDLNLPQVFYLLTKKNQKVNFLPFLYTENTSLVDDIYFPLDYIGVRDLYYSEEDYLYYIYMPGYNLSRETYSITGDIIKNVKWRVRSLANANTNTGITSSTIPADQDLLIGTIGTPQIVVSNTDEAQYLQPSPIFINEDAYFCIEACVGQGNNYQTMWIQPLIIRQNLYQSEILNQWTGKTVISEESNYIMSQAIGAGSKNADNQFSGVFMGKVGDKLDDTSAQHGLYGFHKGVQAFGFRENGTAFIGKPGSGRIDFNGDKGTITSKSYSIDETGVDPQPQRGAYLDLDEGYLGIKTIDQSYYNDTAPAQGIIIAHRPQRNADGTLPSGKSLLNIGPKYQFIQSANYSADSNTGMKIDLNNGKITGYNANLQFKNGNNTVTISSDVGTNGYPINVNNKFTVDWEGKLGAIDASLTGNLSSGTVGGWTINNQGIYKHTKVVWGDETIDTSEVYSDEFINYITGNSTNCYTKIYAPNRGGEIGANGLTPDKSVIFSSGYEYSGKKIESSSLEDLLNCWTTYQNTKKIPAQPSSLWWMKNSYYEKVMKTTETGLIIIVLTLGSITLAAANSVKFIQIYNNGDFNFGGGTDTLKFRADTKVTNDTRWPLYINSTNSTCFFGVAFGQDKTGTGIKYNFGIRFQSLGSKNYVIINHHGIKFVKNGEAKYYDPWK